MGLLFPCDTRFHAQVRRAAWRAAVAFGGVRRALSPCTQIGAIALPRFLLTLSRNIHARAYLHHADLPMRLWRHALLRKRSLSALQPRARLSAGPPHALR